MSLNLKSSCVNYSGLNQRSPLDNSGTPIANFARLPTSRLVGRKNGGQGLRDVVVRFISHNIVV